KSKLNEFEPALYTPFRHRIAPRHRKHPKVDRNKDAMGMSTCPLSCYSYLKGGSIYEGGESAQLLQVNICGGDYAKRAITPSGRRVRPVSHSFAATGSAQVVVSNLRRPAQF